MSEISISCQEDREGKLKVIKLSGQVRIFVKIIKRIIILLKFWTEEFTKGVNMFDNYI